jgi:DNA-binding response OmpR family regulator
MPDIILLASNCQPRALVRAQLIEEGFDVVAMDDWSAAAALLKDRRPPDLVVLDLEGFPHADDVLTEIRELTGSARKLDKRSEVVQTQRGHPELNLADSDTGTAGASGDERNRRRPRAGR